MENEKNNVPVDQNVSQQNLTAQNIPQQNVNQTVEQTVNSAGKKEDDNDRKKILTAFLMLVVTAISLTTASYAWFTENTTVTVDDITVKVSTTNGIQISTDAVNWKANISNTDITSNAYTGNTNQLPISATNNTITPVSTVGEVSDGKMLMYKGSLVSDNSLADNSGYRLESTLSPEAAGTTGDFIAFDMFLMTTQEMTVYLGSNSNVVVAGQNAVSGLQNASRVAFLNEGVVATVGYTPTGDAPTAADAAIALNGAASHTTTNQTTNIFWEPNANQHTATGIANALKYGKTLGSTEVLLSYNGVKAAIGSSPAVSYITTATQDSANFGTVTPEIQTNADATIVSGKSRVLANLGAGINKIRVYGWVEGQDYDCEDTVSGTSITFSIEITKNAPSN